MNRIYKYLPEVQEEELSFLDNITQNYNDEQLLYFCNIYRNRRKDPTLLLILCLIGFVGFSGLHRFFLGQIGMGIIYLFTGGLCLIGTIVDAVNFRTLAYNYNCNVAIEIGRTVN